MIDDETDVRQVFSIYLSSVGHQVLQAENGRIGLELIREQKPAVVLCDLRMPVLKHAVDRALVLHDGRQATYIGERSLPVGLFDQAAYQMQEQVLAEKFLLVLCSDGILELLPQLKIEEKEAQLLAMVNTVDITTAQFIANLGISERETGLPDDVTVLFIKR